MNLLQRKTKLTKRTKRLLIVLLLCLIAAGVFFFFQRKKPKQPELSENFTTETALIERQTLSDSISATGTVASAKTKTVNTSLKGLEVSAVYVSEGDYVEEGTVICEFDASDYKKALSEAKHNQSINTQIDALNDSSQTSGEAAVRSAYESLKELISAKDEAKAALAQAEAALAQEKNAQTEETYNQAKAQLEQITSQCDKAWDAYDDAVEKNELETQKKALEDQLITQTQEERTIEEYTDLIEDCVVTASMSGVITALNVTEGNVFEGGDVYTIQDNEHFVVTASVDEYDIASIKKGMRAYVKTDATEDTEMSGEVTYVAIAPASANGMGGSSTGSYTVKVSIEDPSENIRAGMTARLSISLEESENTLTVPYDAVTTKGNVSYITIDDNGEQKEIEVTTGISTDYYTEVFSDEISEGMTVYLSTPLVTAQPSIDEGLGGLFNRDQMPGGGNTMPGGGGDRNMPSGGGGERPSGGPGGF